MATPCRSWWYAVSRSPARITSRRCRRNAPGKPTFGVAKKRAATACWWNASLLSKVSSATFVTHSSALIRYAEGRTLQGTLVKQSLLTLRAAWTLPYVAAQVADKQSTKWKGAILSVTRRAERSGVSYAARLLVRGAVHTLRVNPEVVYPRSELSSRYRVHTVAEVFVIKVRRVGGAVCADKSFASQVASPAVFR